MIQINVISRISEDKNCFFDLIYAVHQLKEKNIDDIAVLFIGDIITKTLYHDMLKLINLFDLSAIISFTRRSIRYNDLPDDIKNGYFLNFTIGNFKGYSGIESIKMGFKTIFYNADKRLSEKTSFSPSQCVDIPSLVTLVTKIKTETAMMNKIILEDNLRMKDQFILGSPDCSFLKSVLGCSLTDKERHWSQTNSSIE